MKNGLMFFKRTSSKWSWNIAAFHSPHSLTWSWILSFSFFRSDEARVRPLWFKYRTNDGLQWGFRIPFVGMFHWHRQRPMWFRDLFYRQEREKETAENLAYKIPEANFYPDGIPFQ